MKPKYTPWFDMTDPPSRDGLYQTRGLYPVKYAEAYFDGRFWRDTDYDRWPNIIVSPFKWRGLAEKP